VSKRHNIIEVNGKRYDALTGRLVEGGAPQPRTGVVLDGIAKKQAVSAPVHRNPSSAHTAHKVHQKTEKSKTLMRSAVHKPAAVKRAIVLDGVQKSQPRQAPKAAGHPAAQARRASEIPKSRLISKFGHQIPQPVKPKFDVLPVQAPPEPQPTAKDTMFQSLHHAVNPFQHALEHATSHTQPKAKKLRTHHKLARKMGVKPRVVSAGAAALSVLLIGGFFAYQNVPNLAMRVAAAKAGVNGSLPSYQPSGFAIKGPIQLASGQVTVSYRSNSDDRAFKVTQRASEWNSDALLKNYVAVDNRPYQTYQDEDKTIYMYDGGNATWIERGVWYQIEGKKALSSDQLLRMAKSL
jgi:hypothetical protein